MARLAVKLLLLDEHDRVLLIHAKDPRTQAECWYPVGGGIEPGETVQEAAAREAYEETGLIDLPPGFPVWVRDHTYELDGRVIEVHEKWLVHTIDHFEPAPTQLSEYEAQSILGFRWWQAQELAETTATVFPPGLGRLLMDLLTDGVPAVPVDIGEPWRTPDPLGLRPAQPSDRPFFFEVRRAAFRAYVEELFGWDEAEQRVTATKEFAELPFEIIEIGGDPIGYLCVLHEDGYDFIEEIALLPAAQGGGIGRSVLQRVMDNAQNRGVAVRLSVFSNNPARRLYERLGFRVTKIEPPRIGMELTPARH